MRDGARRRLDLLLGRRTCFPPPRVPAEPGALRAALAAWRDGAGERYARTFLQGRPLHVRREERALFERLAEVGVVERLAPAIVQPCVRLVPLYGRFLATDLLAHRDPDQVFSLMFEQVYFVRNFDVRGADRVLEIGLGCGVIALFAADVASAVTGVDVNPRALAFTRFNEALGPGARPLEVLEGSLFEPLPVGRVFDTILVNPPFELVPDGEPWFLHSHGGEDGLDVVRRILAHAPGRLAPAGRFQIVTWSPAGARGPLLVDLLREAFPGHRITVHLLQRGPLDAYLAPFRDRPGFEAWRARLGERGLQEVQFLYARTAPSRTPGVEVVRPDPEVAACHGIAAPWA